MIVNFSSYELWSIMGVGVVLCSHLHQPGWEGGRCQGGEGEDEEEMTRAELQKDKFKL